MKIASKFFYCVVLFTIPLSLYSEGQWSHLKDIATNSDAYIAKWIVDGKPVNYCIFLGDGVAITKQSASIQVRSAIKNWLNSISFYDPKNKVYWKNGAEINLNAVIINELNCSLVSNSGKKSYSTKASDVNNIVVPMQEYLSVFFNTEEGRAYYTAFNIESNTVQPIMKIYIRSQIDTLSLASDKYKQNFEDILTVQIPNKLYLAIQNKKDYIYSSQNFCVDYGRNHGFFGYNSSSSFNTILHEMGHAFGLGDEYSENGALAGTQRYNDTNFMSGSTNSAAMKNCTSFFPTKDDVVGLTYLFDRFANRDLSKRTFDFKDYPSSKYAFASEEVLLINEDGEKIVEKKQEDQKISQKKDGIDSKKKASVSTQELRTKKVIDIEMGSNSDWLKISDVSYDNLKTRIIPKLIDQDAKLRMKPKNEAGETSVVTNLAITISNLQSLPPDISKLTGLKKLDLSLNTFFALPTEVTTFKELEKLDMSFNRLNSLPSNISNLSKLTKLDLGSNDFATFPLSITTITGLTDLCMDRNKLSSLPSDIYNLSRLENLSLEENNFNSIPLDLTRFPNLRYLDLSKNPIKSITPEQVKSMSNLTYLFIDVENLDETSQNLLKELTNVRINPY